MHATEVVAQVLDKYCQVLDNQRILVVIHDHENSMFPSLLGNTFLKTERICIISDLYLAKTLIMLILI